MSRAVRAFARRPTHAMRLHEWGTRPLGWAIFAVVACITVGSQEPAKQVTWRFDNTASLGWACDEGAGASEGD